MTARGFDPVRSAALRQELEALADGAGSPARPRVRALRRPQVWVTAVTAILLVAATAGVLRLTAGTAPIGGASPTPTSTFHGPEGVADPLAEIMDPSSDADIRTTPRVLLHVAGDGSDSFAVPVPEGVTMVRVYLNCAPEPTRYTVSLAGDVTHGTCDTVYGGSYAAVPVQPGSLTAAVSAPAGTGFALLVIATPVYAPSTPGPSQAPLPYPTNLAADPVLGRARGDSRIVTGHLSGSMRGVSVSITCEGDGSITIATAFGTFFDPTDRGGCGATMPLQNGGALSGSDVVTDPEYTITPYGDVRWTVTFLGAAD